MIHAGAKSRYTDNTASWFCSLNGSSIKTGGSCRNWDNCGKVFKLDYPKTSWTASLGPKTQSKEKSTKGLWLIKIMLWICWKVWSLQEVIRPIGGCAGVFVQLSDSLQSLWYEDKMKSWELPAAAAEQCSCGPFEERRAVIWWGWTFVSKQRHQRTMCSDKHKLCDHFNYDFAYMIKNMQFFKSLVNTADIFYSPHYNSSVVHHCY